MVEFEVYQGPASCTEIEESDRKDCVYDNEFCGTILEICIFFRVESLGRINREVEIKRIEWKELRKVRRVSFGELGWQW